MPKPNKNRINLLKKKKPIYTFDMKRIIKEREAERKKNPAFDDLIKNACVEIKETDVETSVLPTLKECDGVDLSKYNIPFDDNTDSTSFLQRLHIMSIELNEVSANIHFNVLMNANWSPVLKDFEDVLWNRSTDLDSLSNDKPLLKYNNKNRHNFELVLRFIHYSVTKKPSRFNDDDLLTLAKHSIRIYFNPQCRQRNNVIKKIFSTCIETALHRSKDTAIKLFAQELYSNRPLEDLLDMIVGLFLPKEGRVLETIYSYLTYTTYMTLLGKNKKTVTFPRSINNWFVQDLVNKNYFKQKSIKIAYDVISLLEHVVAVFDLYTNKEKLRDMYDFLYCVIRQDGLSESQIYINKMDQWRLRLFGLQITTVHAGDFPYEP